MSIKYKLNVLSALKEAGYNTTRIRKEKIFGERVVQQFRTGEVASKATITKLCQLLNCQPGDILEYVEE